MKTLFITTVLFAVLFVDVSNAADAQSLRVARQQAEIQLNLAQRQLDDARKALNADQRALDNKVAAEGEIQVISRDASGHPKTTRKGTGDNGAQTTINGLQIKVLNDTAEVNKWSAEVFRLQQQIATLDMQLVAVDSKPNPGTQSAVGTAGSKSGRVKVGNKILDRSTANLESIRGVVEKREEGRKWPFFVNRYPGVWVRTDSGERVLIFGSSAMTGERVDIETADLHKKFEVRVLQQVEPVKD